MTGRERLLRTLNLERVGGRVPHFEISMFLTMEAIGKVHPKHRKYSQWNQMSLKEKTLTMTDMADVYVEVAKKYDYDAIFVNYQFPDIRDQIEFLYVIRERSGGEYMLLTHGDATFAIPDGNNLEEFSYRLVDEPEILKEEADAMVDEALEKAGQYERSGLLDGFILCSDYCFNTGPFLSPAMFGEFVTPYLKRLVKSYRDMGFYTIKHTDGNIMPILDQLAEARPHALHSIDPQAGVDIGEVKRRYGDKMCLMGNVNCGLMQTGTREEVIKSALYSLEQGMSDGKGYIFSTSNCVYTGMPLERYELIVDVWRRHGIYQSEKKEVFYNAENTLNQ